MNTKFSRQLTFVSACLVIGSWAATSCAPIELEQGNSPVQSNTLSAYPAPTIPETAVVPATLERSYGVWVTPLPSEKVRVGPIVELATMPPPLGKSQEQREYIADTIAQGEGTLSFSSFVVVTDTKSNKRIASLGDETTQSRVVAQVDEVIIWYCGACKEPPLGVYAYNAQTGDNDLIAQDPILYAKTSSEWFVYLKTHADRKTAELYAYNLKAHKQILITDEMAIRQPGSFTIPGNPYEYFAVSDKTVLWMIDLAKSTTRQELTLRAYDLTTDDYQTLNLPERLQSFSRLQVSGSLVVWKTDFWQGYDLSRDAYFSVPIMPAGWEGKKFADPEQLVVDDGKLYWTLPLEDKTHYFSASIEPNEVIEPIGTPNPTLPVTTPTAAPLPTSYP